ncbi:MAG: non-hydrolyzing UDP-N-acetylglucosamine 2-epimerase [Bacteroidota bacterium]
MGEVKKIAVILGTRSDAVKLAPVILQLQLHEQFFSLCIISAAPNRESISDVLAIFHISPSYDLSVAGMRQSLSVLAQNMLEKMDYVLAVESPDMVIVQGDTVTTFTSALAAFHRRIPVVHVEAGLRSGNRSNPFPDEGYRVMTSRITDIHCTPTVTAAKILLSEGIGKENILCTGSTSVDALHQIVKPDHQFPNDHVMESVRRKERIVVVTVHRPEHISEPMLGICSAVKELAQRYSSVRFIFPVHLNPSVRETVFDLFKDIPNMLLLEPMNYADFVNMVACSTLVITDSGSLQEEAHSLGKPVILLRDMAEQTEAVRSGAVTVVGTDAKKIVKASSKILQKRSQTKSKFTPSNLYGDGRASVRISELLLKYFGFSKKQPAGFRPKSR